MSQSRRLAAQPARLSLVRIATLSAAALALAATVTGAGSAAASPAAGYTASYIPAGSALPEFVAVNPATNTVYLTEDNASLIVIDGASQAVTTAIDLPWQTRGVAVDSATDTVYVVTASPPVQEIGVIDGSTDSVVQTISLPSGETPSAIAVDDVTNRIYVAEWTATSSGVLVIDGSTNDVIGTVSTGDGSGADAITVDQSTGVVWVASDTGLVTAISEATDLVLGTVQVNGDPNSMAANPVTNTVYVAALPTAQQPGGIAVINGSTTTLTTTLAVADLGGIAVDPGTDVIYASADSGPYGDTTIIDGASNSVADTVGRGGSQAAVDTATGVVYETSDAQDSDAGLWAITPSATNAMSPIMSAPGGATFTVSTPGSVAFAASALPAATFTETGNLPTGLALSPAGVLSGTPAAGTAGVYSITVVASNGIAPDFSLPFTFNVDEVPSITSAGQVTFNTGAAGSFTVTATGFPAPVLSESGALPAGVTFDSTDGVLAGTPAAGTAGRYPILMSASNAGGIASQQFTLVVEAAGESLGLPAGGVLGDVTGNGRADLLGIDPSGNLWLYPNTGSANAGMFAGGRSQVGSGWTGYTLAAVTPLYGSARAGLLAIAPGGNLWYYPNTATTGTSVTFGGRSLVGTGWTGYTVVGVTALYVTGQLGILAIDPSGNLWWYPTTGGTGTSTFGGRSLVGTGWTGYTADVADINLSTSPDLLAIDSSGNMWLYPSIGGGTGTSTFGSPTLLGVGWSGYQAVDAGLLTTSSYADVLAIDPEGNLWYYPNNDGLIGSTFGTPLEIGPGWTGYRIN